MKSIRPRKLLLITMLIILGFIAQIFAQTNNSLSTNQTDGLEFDKEQLFILCPNPFFEQEEPVIGVKTKIFGQAQNLKYKYSVSGGRIIGTSAKVYWDLNKMPPGLYKIAVNVRGVKLERKFVKEIRLNVPEHCDIPCVCPSLSIINSPENTRSEKTVVFTAQAHGGSQTQITYKWTVSEGKIFKGQGTAIIKVKTKGLEGKKITVMLEVGGDLCAECYRLAESTLEVN